MMKLNSRFATRAEDGTQSRAALLKKSMQGAKTKYKRWGAPSFLEGLPCTNKRGTHESLEEWVSLVGTAVSGPGAMIASPTQVMIGTEAFSLKELGAEAFK